MLGRRALIRFLFLVLLMGCVTSRPPDPEAPRRVAELEKENAQLREQIDSLQKRVDALTAVDFVFDGLGGPPSIDALVVSVDRGLELVVLDKGKLDGVKVGYVFDLYHGSTYKGQVRVQDVLNSTCSAKILSEKSEIAAGDNATTQL